MIKFTATTPTEIDFTDVQNALDESAYIQSWQLVGDCIEIDVITEDQVHDALYSVMETGVPISFGTVLSSSDKPAIEVENYVLRTMTDDRMSATEDMIVGMMYDNQERDEKIDAIISALQQIKTFFDINPVHILSEVCDAIDRPDLLGDFKSPTIH